MPKIAILTDVKNKNRSKKYEFVKFRLKKLKAKIK